jgi:hypothetical protein
MLIDDGAMNVVVSNWRNPEGKLSVVQIKLIVEHTIPQ